MKKNSIRYIVYSLLGIGALAYLTLYPTSYTQPAFAQNCLTAQTLPRVTNGLITTPSFTSNNLLGTDTTGKCIKSEQAPLAPFKIPTYDDLKSLYFDQSKQAILKHTITADIDGNTHQINDGSPIDVRMGSGVYYFTGNLIIDSPSASNGFNCGINLGGGSAIVFVNGNLTISQDCNLSYSNNNGLVFIVKDNIYIDQTITQINAVLISQGIIYTAADTSTTPVTICDTNSIEVADSTKALRINGSLVSLKQPPITDPNASYIKFCRKLAGTANNTDPAEIIIHQPKYLVILRDLFSNTLQKWSEVQ